MNTINYLDIPKSVRNSMISIPNIVFRNRMYWPKGKLCHSYDCGKLKTCKGPGWRFYIAMCEDGIVVYTHYFRGARLIII